MNTVSENTPPTQRLVARSFRPVNFGRPEAYSIAPTAHILQKARDALAREDFDAAVIWSATAVEVAYVNKRIELEALDPDEGLSMVEVIKGRQELLEKIKTLAKLAGTNVGRCRHWQDLEPALNWRNRVIHRGTSVVPQTARQVLDTTEGVCEFIHGLQRPAQPANPAPATDPGGA